MAEVATGDWGAKRQEGAEPTESGSLKIHGSPSGSLRLRMLASYNKSRASSPGNGKENIPSVRERHEA